MIVIKHGRPQDQEQKITYKCVYCGCVFEAEKGEYRVEQGRYNDQEAVATCPECNRMNFHTIGKDDYIRWGQTE